MSDPLVSIITPTWQRPELLERCIKCVDEQKFTDWEHIIVHDGEEPHILAPDENEKRKEICLDKNYNDYGVTPLNVGLAKARGKYFAVFADDNEMSEVHLEQLVKFFEEDPGLAFAYGFALYMDVKTREQRTALNAFVPEWQKIDLGQILWNRELDARFGPWVYTRWSYDWDRVDMMLKAGMRFRVNPDFTFKIWKSDEVRNYD